MKKLIIILMVLFSCYGSSFAQTIGNNVEGTSADTPGGAMHGIRVQCSQDMTVDKIYVKIGTSGSGNIKCAIFNDNIGKPGTFLMDTNELTNPGTGWKSFNLNSGLALTSGTWVHLVLWTDNSGYLFNYTNEGVGTTWGDLGYYGTWPVTFGTASTWHGGTYCIYATGTSTCANPAIITQPQSITMSAGTSATFSVLANGTKLRYQWKKDGQDISNAQSSSYTISSLANGDEGNYTVVVSGECGSPVTSNVATLTICNDPVEITVQPKSISQNLGMSATFNVTANGSNLTYQWKKDGTDIQGATLSSYTVNSIVKGDAGNYTVVVSGECGFPITSNTVSLTIGDPGDYIIEGKTFADATTVWLGVNINRDTPTPFTFCNNAVTSINTSGYMLQAGDENEGSTNNNLDGEIITGNRFTWNGTDMTSITHGVFTGYNINAVIKYNYLHQVPMGIIRKSNGMTNTSGGVAYNIIDKGKIGVVVKGMNGVNIYNNTFYSDRTMADTDGGRPLVDVYSNDSFSPARVSSNTKIKNNIFYTKNQIYNIRVYSDCLTGFESDYNIFYCESGTPLFDYGGVVKTFAQWQALGFDTHSVIVNPNFLLNSYVPSVPLYKGKDLGEEWKQGLSPSAVWGTTAPALATQDSSIWQCGAYIVSSAPVADYYVSPNGSDSNNGDITHPFYSLKKVWTVIKPGDLVYLRGGTYYMPTSQELRGKNGTADNPIKIWAYPGETPVITKVSSGWTYLNRAGIYFEGNYFHWKGITVSGFTQTDANLYYAMIMQYSNHNTIEQMTFSYSGCGFDLSHGSTDNLILNCDCHHNYDPLTSGDPYGNADGANAHVDTGTTNTFRDCRFYYNSDDGIDLYNGDGLILIDGCWSWMNGYKEDGITPGGNGMGYKLGRTSGDFSSSHLRTITNSLAFHNRQGGFGINEAKCICWLYNNTVYHNNDGEDYHLGFEFDGGDGIAHVLKNNIAYGNQGTWALEANWTAQSICDHNAWDAEGITTASDADFLSLNMKGVDGARQADGNLPNLDFLKLAPTSQFINAGVNVGLPYNGTAPDLGAFETGPITSNSSLASQNSGFRVFPNPVKNLLNISSTDVDMDMVTLKLYDIRGIKLYESNEIGNCKLDFSKYQSGVYILVVESKGNSNTFKILK